MTYPKTQSLSEDLKGKVCPWSSLQLSILTCQLSTERKNAMRKKENIKMDDFGLAK